MSLTNQRPSKTKGSSADVAVDILKYTHIYLLNSAVPHSSACTNAYSLAHVLAHPLIYSILTSHTQIPGVSTPISTCSSVSHYQCVSYQMELLKKTGQPSYNRNTHTHRQEMLQENKHSAG